MMRATKLVPIVLLTMAVGLLSAAWSSAAMATEIHVTASDSVQAAVDRAHPGDVIKLSSWTWHENIRIAKSILIVADFGAKPTIMSNSATTPVVTITPPSMYSRIDVYMRGIAIVGSRDGNDPGTGGSGYDPIKNRTQSGIELNGYASLNVRSCSIALNNGSGIIVSGHAQFSALDVLVTGNGVAVNSTDGMTDIGLDYRNGVVVKDYGRASLVWCKLIGNVDDGLWVKDAAYAEMRHCELAGNYRGTEVYDGAKADISRTDIHDNTCTGVFCMHQEGVSIGPQHRWPFHDYTVNLTRCTIQDNGEWGVVVANTTPDFMGCVRGRGNTIEGNGGACTSADCRGEVCPASLTFLTADTWGNSVWSTAAECDTGCNGFECPNCP